MKLLGFQIGASVPKKEDKLFDIFQDGEGRFSAKHVTGDFWGKWLNNSSSGLWILSGYEYRKRFKTIELCNSACEAFIKQREHNHVGTISFTPNN